ncbi:hypothetical protein JCM8097_002439 [Rhodosporidiobolus ruineniae]
MPSPSWWTAYAAWAAGTIAVARMINADVTEPYMDEIFHVPQAQAYCQGDWGYWDGALTTPPGLYLIPAALAHAQRISAAFLPPALLDRLPTVDFCSLSSLRGLNLAIALLLPFLYRSLLRLLHSPSYSTPSSRGRSPLVSSATLDWEALTVALFPLVGWWAWLFYTDMLSLVSVLLCWREALKGRYARSAALGFASLWFRQTNIVWLAFVAGQAVVSRLKVVDPATVHDPPLAFFSFTSLFRTPLSLVHAVLRNPLAVSPILASFLPVFTFAVAFVQWNGGIVLGDKQNHIATLHVPQVYYFLAFAGAFFAPRVLSLRKVGRAVKGSAGTPSRALVSLVTLGGMCWTIKHYTIAHPFLLADNRHFAFYLWCRVINVHPLARYALAPGYLFAARLLWDELARARRMETSKFILFAVSTAAVLVPTPLLEPRYYLTPLVLLRLHLSPSPSAPSSSSSPHSRLALEALLYVAIQAACVYLFLFRTFFWDVQIGADGRGLEGRDEREVGRVQRFMW